MDDRQPPLLQGDPGVRAFCALLDRIEALPEVLRPGFRYDDDDSTRFDHEAARKLVDEALADVPRGEFSRAIGTYLSFALHGYVSGGADEEWFSSVFNDAVDEMRDQAPPSNVVSLAAARDETALRQARAEERRHAQAETLREQIAANRLNAERCRAGARRSTFELARDARASCAARATFHDEWAGDAQGKLDALLGEEAIHA